MYNQCSLKTIAAVCGLVFMFVLVPLATRAQNVDATVEKIRARYADITEKVKLAEEDDDRGQYGEIFMNELDINKRNHQWRAVGINRLTYKFFYTAIDESANPPAVVERHLYPDQLVKVVVTKQISSRSYTEEFLFDTEGRLIFYFQTAENDDQAPKERRVYFAAGKAIRVIEDSKKRDVMTMKDLKTVAQIVHDSSAIKTIFNISLAL